MIQVTIFLALILLIFISDCNRTIDSLSITSGTTTAITTTTVQTSSGTYNDPFIPSILTGKTFDLTLEKSTKQLITGLSTDSYEYKKISFLWSILIMNRGDNVQMNFINNLTKATTMHWHGFHIPSIMKRASHQLIEAGTTWNPFLKLKNNACLYWYYQHLLEKPSTN